MAINTSPAIMDFTPSSVLSCLGSSSLLLLLAWALLRSDSGLRFVGKYIFFFLAASLIRMLLPLEFHFTKSFYSKHVMTAVMDILYFEIKVGAYRIAVYEAFFFLWIAGAACRLFVTVRNYLHFSHFISRLPGYFEGDVPFIMDKVNKELGKHQKFDVRLLPYSETPAIFGIAHPKILMPATHYEEEDLYYILKHEMLHYYRHDMLIKLFCEGLCIIYWWNPCAYLLRKMTARIIEINVDNSVVGPLDGDRKTNYLKCILKSMKTSREQRADFMITFSAAKNPSVRQRFQCVLEGYWVTRKIRRVFITVLAALLFFLSISVIFEAEYPLLDDDPDVFDYPNSETSYLMKNGDDYEVYIDGEYMCKIRELKEPFLELNIYDKEEIPTNEK